MKKYTEIFDEIVDIMREDSSTCKDLGCGPYEKYKKMIYDSMPRKQFVKTVKQYLCEFKLPGHLKFTDATMGNIDYEVIRKENCLYVTKVAKGSNLRVGDKIIQVDSVNIEDTAQSNSVFLMDEPFNRQTHLWWQILMFSNMITIIRDGCLIKIPIKLSANVVYDEEKYYYKVLEDKSLYLRMADFFDDYTINNMMTEVEPLLAECETLVIDVRGNGGGSSQTYGRILEYCFPEGEQEILDYGMEINYTERNCESRLRIFKEFFGDDITEELKTVLEAEKQKLQILKGKKFVRETNDKRIVNGRKYPLSVKIYTDEGCCSAGENFVEIAAKSPKVTVIGRPTMGINDYSNCTNAVWGDFYLAYPTSRSCRIDVGKKMQGKGVPVDIYVEN